MVWPRGTRSFFGSWCTLLALSGFAREARAQARAMEPSRGMVRSHLSAGGREFAVYFGRGERPIADCASDCDFWAWPGTYRVVVRRGEGPFDDSALALRIDGARSYRFVPANGGAQNAGVILGVSGPLLGVAGITLTTIGLLSDNRPALSYAGLAGMGAGAGMTGVGWVLYAQNRARFELSAPPPGALGLSATLRF